MKLVLVTAVEEFQKDIFNIFQKANIENFSSSDIDGYKTIPFSSMASNWFSSGKKGNKSILFFSFTDEEKIDNLFSIIKEFNINMETNNPLKAVVLPIEKFI